MSPAVNKALSSGGALDGNKRLKLSASVKADLAHPADFF